MKAFMRVVYIGALVCGVFLMTSVSIVSLSADQNDELSLYQGDMSDDLYTAEYSDRWVVQFEPYVDPYAFATQYGYVVTENIADLPGWYELQIIGSDFDTQIAQQAVRTLTDAPGVLLAYQQQFKRFKKMDGPPTDPSYKWQWHLKNTGHFLGAVKGIDVNAEAAWKNNYTGKGIHIGIVDDGLQYTHPDLDAPKFIANRSYDYLDGDADVAPVINKPSCDEGDDCHGTSVAGVAAAEANNLVCGAGVTYNATISGQRSISFSVPSTDVQTANALANSKAIDKTPVNISNNSWGYVQPNFPGAVVLAALENGATKHNTIYVFAAGNQAPNNAGAYDLINSRFTIAVGAINLMGRRASYSVEGSAVFVTAPSNDAFDPGIFTTDLMGLADGYNGMQNQGDCTNKFGGTSSAAPLVSGVVALMLEANPNLTWRDVQHILAKSSRQVQPPDKS